MFKYFVVFLVVTLAALFYPYRDLYVRDDVFRDNNYELVAKGYWTRGACIEAARAQAAEDFQCRQRSLFGSMVRASGRYSHSGYEAEQTR